MGKLKGEESGSYIVKVPKEHGMENLHSFEEVEFKQRLLKAH